MIGGGQLARMLALEGRRMGYRFAVLDPDPTGSAAQASDEHVQGAWDDVEAAAQLAKLADVVTVDTEHVPADLLDGLGDAIPLRPGPEVMRTVQDRLTQRTFLAGIGVPQPPHLSVATAEDLPTAATEVGLPAFLKARTSGYDGRGQRLVTDADGLAAAWQAVGGRPCVLEGFVDFASEVSVVAARTNAGEMAFYPLMHNVHRDGILHTSSAPARVTDEVRDRAEEIARTIADGLGHVGVIAVEMFLMRDGQLLVNEIAPRVHNSGHLTFGACVTSQFEQHLRAICDLPLGDPSLLRPAAMVNLLGDLWEDGIPAFEAALGPDCHLHLYGKSPRPARKLGHVLVFGTDAGAAEARAEEILAGLRSGTGA